MISPPIQYALVLPGAVARGAFEAGVIKVLVEEKLQINRIVATSSGALNGIALAYGIRFGREKEMVDKLIKTWIDQGSWHNSMSFNLFHLFNGRGLSDSQRILKLMRDLIKPSDVSPVSDVELCIITCPLNGVMGSINGKEATTYEKILRFSGKDFDTKEGLECIFNAVTAATAFPFLFEPVKVKDYGFCIDGAAVNNAPIRVAVEEPDVEHLIMPIPFPAIMKLGDKKSGLSLASHFAEILVNERLYRDLKSAYQKNDQADQLTEMVKDGVISEDQFKKLKKIIPVRKVEITQIRPEKDLKGNSFAGFFHKENRIELVKDGILAAHKAFPKLNKRPANVFK
jgi:predicted acylesterase/phospholipase RssA